MNAEKQNHAKTMHAKVDAFFEALRVTQPENFNPPCKAGCFWCCYEPLYSNAQEADYALSGLTPEQLEALKPRVHAWLAQARPLLPTVTVEGGALDWRRANIPCPLLVDGKCSVYDRRPVGCRSHFAMSHPENCAMPMREHQKFATFSSHPTPIDLYMAQYAFQCGRNHMDHFGIHLANKVLGLKLHSAAGEIYEIEQEATA